MLPPNLRVLDVHWLPGSSSNTLFQISFSSPTAQITYYSRCGTIFGASGTNGALATGACGFQLDEAGYAYLAQSNAGTGNVAVVVRGTDDTGTGVGTSQAFNIQFAQEAVNGGVYYWDVSHTRIMRFDFGGLSSTPDVFLAPGDYGTNKGNCVGCHALSRDGTKMAASALGQGNGLLVYINGVAAPTTPLTMNEDGANRIQFASFDPVGDLFVGIYGDGSPLDPKSLDFHDGTTGQIVPSLTKQLSFEPDHPAWSPDGTMIAMTHVGGHNTSQMMYLGGIDVASLAAGVGQRRRRHPGRGRRRGHLRSGRRRAEQRQKQHDGGQQLQPRLRAGLDLHGLHADDLRGERGEERHLRQRRLETTCQRPPGP